MSERRGAILPHKLTAPRDDRPNSAKPKACSDRISQLALPNRHIVSSVLKDHCKTLSKDHIDRLMNLLEEIKIRKVTLSRSSFMDTLKDFEDEDKKQILEVLDKIQEKHKVQESPEWKQIKLQPVKYSSDTFLIRPDKQASVNTQTRADECLMDFSGNVSIRKKSSAKKSIDSIKWNYTETIFINIEGAESYEMPNIGAENYEIPNIEQCSKYVQTEKCDPEVSDSSSRDIAVLFFKTKKPVKTKKRRQLHTLETDDFLKPNARNEIYDKVSQTTGRTIQLPANVKIAIDYICRLYRLYILITYYFNIVWKRIASLDIVQNCCVEDIFSVLSNTCVDIKCRSSQLLDEMYSKLLKAYYLLIYESSSEDEIRHGSRRRKKQKRYYTKSYHFSNVASILH